MNKLKVYETHDLDITEDAEKFLNSIGWKLADDGTFTRWATVVNELTENITFIKDKVSRIYFHEVKAGDILLFCGAEKELSVATCICVDGDRPVLMMQSGYLLSESSTIFNCFYAAYKIGEGSVLDSSRLVLSE